MNREEITEIYKKYELNENDIFVIKFGNKSIPIIKREGVEKIQTKLGINVEFDLIYHSSDLKTAVVKATGKVQGKTIESFGEVSPNNNTQKYPIAMAEKRALSRVVLKLSGAYSEGVFSEDESEEFKRNG